MVKGEIKEEKRELTEAEYRKIPMLSSSDLRLFITDKRKFFKTKVLGEIAAEEYNKSLLIGSIVHTLLLEPEEFDNRYFLTICEKVPTGNMLVFVESLYRHTVANLNEEGELQVEFAELIKFAYEESGYKISVDAVLKKFKENGEDYYLQMREAKLKGLEVVCMDDITIAHKIIEMIKMDEFCGELFSCGINGITAFNEVKLDEFDLLHIKMKAMLDRIIVDEQKKTIQLIDLKVVYNNQDFYREYYLKRRADLQGYVYFKALESRKIDLGFDYNDYEILLPIFCAVDSGCFFRPLLYQMDTKNMKDAYDGFIENGRYYPGIREILEEIDFAVENGIWNITKEAFKNKGIVSLKKNG